MNIIDIFHTDSLPVVIRKCNENFRQLAFNNAKTAKMQNVDVTQALTDMQGEINQMISHTIPNEVSAQITAADIPSQVNDAIAAADIQQQVSDAVNDMLDSEFTTTLSDFFVEDSCTVTACLAERWGDVVFIRFSYRLNSDLTVPSNGDVTDVTLGTLKIGWRPVALTNVILDQTKILVGDVDSSGSVKVRSANSRGISYIIDANTILYASMTFILGLQ